MNFKHTQICPVALWLCLSLSVSVLLNACQSISISTEVTSVPLVVSPVATTVLLPQETPQKQETVASASTEQVIDSESTAPTAADVSTPPVDPLMPTDKPNPTMEIVESTSPTATPAQELTKIETISPVYHIVKAGDTVFDIAWRYEVSVEEIVTANQLASADMIHIGQRLLIPTGSPVAPPIAIPLPVTEAQSDQETSPRLHGTVYSCPENTAVYPLSLASDPIQIMAAGERIFLIADGSLYEISLSAGQGEQPIVTNLMPPEKIVGKYLIRELVYLTQDLGNGDLLILDKTNDIYRYSRSGVWSMEVPAQPVPGQFPDPQYLAIQERQGSILALDADLSHIWQLSRVRPMPTAYFINRQIESAVDMTLVQSSSGDMLYILTREGTVLRFERYFSGQSNLLQVPVNRVDWPSQVQTNGSQLLVVDGNSRTIHLYEPTDFSSIDRIVFRHANMQRLRHAAVVDQTVFAVAGGTVYIAPLAQLNELCAPVVYDDNFYFEGQNIRDLLPKVGLPFNNVVLPTRPRSYPGARRLYRYGLHEGLDLYALDAPGLTIGSPVSAIADGIVIRVDSHYVEMTPNEYEAAMRQTEEQHRTGAALTDKLLGRQVHIEHSPQVISRYGHLDETAATVSVGEFAQLGTVIGTVGVSGTSSGAYGTNEGAHLHFEIWVNGRYLGQGLNLYETVRLWQEVFR